MHKNRSLKGFKKLFVPAKTTISAEFELQISEVGFYSPISPSVEISIGNGRDSFILRRIDLKKEVLLNDYI